MDLFLAKPSQEILAYTAGIIDGEGHIGIRCGKVKGKKEGVVYDYLFISVEVANTSLVLIKFLLDNFRGNFYAGKRPNRKPYYRWGLSSKKAEEFLRLVYPFLIIKKEQADIIFKFRSTNTRGGTQLLSNVVAIREECYHSLKRLRGA